MIEKISTFMLGMFSALMMYTHPWAAIGASCGCCFFLAMPVASHGWKRFKLGIFSWAIGYGAGVFWYGEGPPYSQKAMLVAAVFAALAAIVFTAWYYVIDKSGPLPEWMESILDRVPMFKRRSDNDGQP